MRDLSEQYHASTHHERKRLRWIIAAKAFDHNAAMIALYPSSTTDFTKRTCGCDGNEQVGRTSTYRWAAAISISPDLRA